MSTSQMLIALYAALFAVAVIARAVTGPIPDLAAGGKGGLYAVAKAGERSAGGLPEMQMAVSDGAPSR